MPETKTGGKLRLLLTCHFSTVIYKTRAKALEKNFLPFIIIEESYLQTFSHSLRHTGLAALPHRNIHLPKKIISPLGSPNLFARRQAFAAIRRRTQWIKRKINGRENEKRRCCASNQGIYAANSLSHLIKKSREQWKLGNIRLHMAKINTYDFLSIHTHLYILV